MSATRIRPISPSPHVAAWLALGMNAADLPTGASCSCPKCNTALTIAPAGVECPSNACDFFSVGKPWECAKDAAAVATARTGRKPLPELVSGSWIAQNEEPLPEELVTGILHKGCKMVLGGGSKSFKTWALADLAISISTGSCWWGLETRQGLVVYLNFEVMQSFFHRRLTSIAEAKAVALNDNLLVWNLRGHAEAAEIILPHIGQDLAGREVAAIIIDPIYKLAAGKDENATKDTAALMQEIERLSEQTGAAVVFGAHFSKGNQAGKEAMDRISGSGVYARDPDAILTMTRHAEDGAFTVESTLRNCPTLPPFAVRWDFPLMTAAPDLDPADLKKAKAGSGKRTFSAEDIIAVMPLGEPLRAGQWQKLASEEIGVSRSRFYELKGEAEANSKISSKDGTFTRIL